MNDQKIQIFVLDDNDIDLVVNERLIALNHFGADVHTFSTYPQLELSLGQQNFCPDAPKLIFLIDIQMPDLNGFDCMEKLATYIPQDDMQRCMFFMLSSSIDRQDVQSALDNPNIERILQKPLDVQLLKSLVGV